MFGMWVKDWNNVWNVSKKELLKLTNLMIFVLQWSPFWFEPPHGGDSLLDGIAIVMPCLACLSSLWQCHVDQIPAHAHTTLNKFLQLILQENNAQNHTYSR